ncbi:PREDICTED: uncharacterized protein LOC107068558 [Polistes dominula]|uniref:Uncharacterized protein LOC107068558 n=1 Tax=Polistes dominula TaxID=743375 RepID=A0ABM1IK28_POLDO|nr:PREDICTED: uncharacterized protein LOC107068558 [Polistes dominula]
MHVLPVSFALLTYVGYWRPKNWSTNSIKSYLYNIYTLFMIFVICSFAICSIVDAYVDQNVNTFIEKFTLTISVVAVCIKIINLTLRRNSIISLFDMLLKDFCLPRNLEEQNVQEKFDEDARRITIYVEFLNEATVIFAIIDGVKEHVLPFANWTPYDHSSEIMFWLFLLYQSIALLVVANSSVAHETIISGLMIQICAQFEIFSHRIKTLPMLLEMAKKNCNYIVQWKKEKNRIIRELIDYHLYIYSFATKVNSVFTTMIMLQFSISSIVLCLTVYRMSKAEIASIEFIWGVSYLGSMFMQIFLYCWFGNEVILKSMQIGDMFYEMDWTSLENDIVKIIPIIMLRSTKPIEMRSGYIIVLSAQSFTSILNTSYSMDYLVYVILEADIRIMIDFVSRKVESYIDRTIHTKGGLVKKITTLSLSQIIGIVLNISSDLSEDIYVSLTIAISCLKMLTFKINYNDVVELINALNKKEPYVPSDEEEIEIQLKFDKLARYNTNGYTSLIGFSVSSFVFMSLINDLRNGQLTFQEVWLPFDNTTPIRYYLIYTQQILGMTLAGFLNVALDSLICGIFIHICCQIKILENRLTKITDKRKTLLILCIRHHEYIYKFADNVNQIFGLIIFFQFFGSTLTVCFTLYQLTKISPASVEYAKMSLYMYCMLIQIFLYCWYGNLITLKSKEIIDKIFGIDWTILNNSTKTSLLIMMSRTIKPISMVVIKVFSLNLDSFISIIKTAYSAYNLLQQTQG